MTCADAVVPKKRRSNPNETAQYFLQTTNFISGVLRAFRVVIEVLRGNERYFMEWPA
jgi:hypothetical protein